MEVATRQQRSGRAAKKKNLPTASYTTFRKRWLKKKPDDQRRKPKKKRKVEARVDSGDRAVNRAPVDAEEEGVPARRVHRGSLGRRLAHGFFGALRSFRKQPLDQRISFSDMDLDIDTGVDEGQQELTHRQWIRRVWDHRRTMDTKFSNLLAHHNWSIIRNNEIIRPTTIATLIQRPNFREDFKVYNKEFTSKPETDGSSFLTEDETTIRFSDSLSTMEFMLSLGFDERESWLATQKKYINLRLKAAIKEAKVWANRMTKNQGQLLYLLATEVPSEVLPFYNHLVEAIINKRITDVNSLANAMAVMKEMNKGRIGLKDVFGSEMINNIREISMDEGIILKRIYRERFRRLRKAALKWANIQQKAKLSPEAEEMLAWLTIEYQRCLKQHLPLLTQYIGQDVLTCRTQLTTAIIFLQMHDSEHPVNNRNFEKCCGLPIDQETGDIPEGLLSILQIETDEEIERPPHKEDI